MAETYAAANVDGQLTTTLAQIVAAPAAGSEKRVNLTLANIAAADVTFDLTRRISSTDRYIGKAVPAKVGEPVQYLEIILVAGSALWARASAATSVDFTADVVTKTVT